MNNENAAQLKAKPRRMGILLHDLKKVNIPALKFLILQLNSLQNVFEYEFLPCDAEDQFIKMLTPDTPMDREKIRPDIAGFLNRYHIYLNQQVKNYRLSEEPPDYFILITLVKFSDEYYSMRQKGLSVLALGNWEREMSPPSILEFILTFTVRESVASISRSLRGSIHLGTKGCLCDFTFYLEDARFKVLQGYVCSYCRKALETDGYPTLANDLTRILSKQWMGRTSNPSSPAGIISNLGFDLFLTKGLKPTVWESFLSTIQEEGVKELIKLIAAFILAALIVWMGFKQ